MEYAYELTISVQISVWILHVWADYFHEVPVILYVDLQ